MANEPTAPTLPVPILPTDAWAMVPLKTVANFALMNPVITGIVAGGSALACITAICYALWLGGPAVVADLVDTISKSSKSVGAKIDALTDRLESLDKRLAKLEGMPQLPH